MKNILKNKYLILVYRITIMCISFWGIYLNFSALDSFSVMPLISYFTILANVFCFIYYFINIIKLIINFKEFDTKYNSFLKGNLLLGLIVTFLVFHFILRPMSFGMINSKYFMSLSNVVVHYLVPIMVLIDFILFDSRGQLKYFDSFKWLTFPFLYWIIITINGMFGYTYSNKSNYPYFFLDINKYGFFTVLRNVIFISLLFLIIGLIIVLIEKIIMKLLNKENLLI